MTKLTQIPTNARKVAAKRCAHCNTPLPSGEGIGVPFIGALGPECVKKYAPLLAVLEQLQGLQVRKGDQPAINFADWAIWKLRELGFVVEVRQDGEDLQVVDIVRLKPNSKKVKSRARAALNAFADMREEFERRLMLASADAQVEVEQEADDELAQDLLDELEERAAIQEEGCSSTLEPLPALVDLMWQEGLQVVGAEGHLPVAALDDAVINRIKHAALELGLELRGALLQEQQEYVLRVVSRTEVAA